MGGELALNAVVDITITDAGGDGKLIGTELTSATNTFTSSGALNGNFPVTAVAAPGITITGAPAFTVSSSDVFASDQVTFTPNADFNTNFKRFSVLQPTDVLRMFKTFSDWLGQVGRSETFGASVPFAAETLLKDLFTDYSRLAALFEEKITNYLAPTILTCDTALAAGEYAPAGVIAFSLILDGVEYAATVTQATSAGNSNAGDVVADLQAAVNTALGVAG